MELFNADVLLHLLIGLAAFVTGFIVRGACKHKGLLPHPVQQISLTLVLVYAEAVLSVALVG
jgi:hypothetical protein